MGKKSPPEISQSVIHARLRKHLNEQRPVTLHNTFQGIPVSYKAEVAMVNPGFIGLIVHPYQCVCIKQERRTYLESKFIRGLVRAYPVSIDYTNQVVVLKELKVPKNITPDLKNSRIAPEKDASVDVYSDSNKMITVKMLEIGVLDENRVRVAMEVPEDCPFARREKVTLKFHLDLEGDLVQVQGVVNSLIKIRNRKSRRMEVDGKATMGDEISILAYIAQREDQILKALDKAFKKMRKGKKRKKN